MKSQPRLFSIATAVPEYELKQIDVAAAVEMAFSSRFGDFQRLSRVFASAGIDRRQSVCPIEWFAEPHGWAERTEAYLRGATGLFVEAARKALDGTGVAAADIDTIVTVSSTGIATPSLEARVADELGFRPDVERVPIFGLGCAGGVTGLAIASRFARARPGSRVLLVAVELCTLAFQLDDVSKANIVATALFGDGAAAAVVSCETTGGLAVIEASGEHQWPDTLGIMGWDVGPRGLGVIFDRAIPPFAAKHLGAAVDGILIRNGLERGDIDRFLCHPGGAKVISALERSLALNQGTLDHERAVLFEHGNMSAPTVLFVLERALWAGLPERSALTALGPGFTASCAILKRAA